MDDKRKNDDIIGADGELNLDLPPRKSKAEPARNRRVVVVTIATIALLLIVAGGALLSLPVVREETVAIAEVSTELPLEQIVAVPSDTPQGMIEPTQFVSEAAVVEPVQVVDPDEPGVRPGGYGVAWSPDGVSLATVGLNDLHTNLWTVDTSDYIALEGHTQTVYSAAWSPDGTMVATGGEDAVRVWDATTGENTFTFPDHFDRVHDVDFSPGGRWLASISEESVRVWESDSGEQVSVFDLTTLNFDGQDVVWSPDGRQLALAGIPSVQIMDWNSETRALSPSRTIGAERNWVYGVAWSPDGENIVTADGTERTVSVWDAESGTRLLQMQGHMGDVNDVVWSPDGALIVSASSDNSLRVWDAGTGANLYVLEGHSDIVRAVAWSPDGTRIASALLGELLVWELPEG